MNRRKFLKGLMALPALGVIAALPKGEPEQPIEVTDQGEVVITARNGLRIDNGGPHPAVKVEAYKNEQVLGVGPDNVIRVGKRNEIRPL